jgi:hypothetical protein
VEDIVSLTVKAIGLALFLGLLFALIKIVNSAGNSLEWWHLVSSRAQDGSQYADWNKIGQGCGVMLCVGLPTVYVYSPKMEAVGLAAVMGVALLYLGGVSGYAANLRSKQGSRVTETEPVGAPGPMKTTVTENPPLGAKP